jgi:hypothetical protein
MPWSVYMSIILEKIDLQKDTGLGKSFTPSNIPTGLKEKTAREIFKVRSREKMVNELFENPW